MKKKKNLPSDRSLFLDIETTPHIVYTWGMWKQDVSPDKVITPSKLLCWAAKFRGKSFFGWNTTEELLTLSVLFESASQVVTYNGKKFDMPIVQREFLQAGLPPPPKLHHVDLLQTVRGKFKFEHNKLDVVAQKLGLGGKVKHEGFGLWLGCMAGDTDSLRKMRSYNERDVVLTEKLYHRLLPWVTPVPRNRDGCRRCGGTVVARGYYTLVSGVVKTKGQCSSCGGWQVGDKVPGEMQYAKQRTVVP